LLLIVSIGCEAYFARTVAIGDTRVVANTFFLFYRSTSDSLFICKYLRYRYITMLFSDLIGKYIYFFYFTKLYWSQIVIYLYN